MIKVLKIFASLFVVSALAVACIYFIYPGVMLTTIQSLSAKGAGLSDKTIDLDGYTAHYFEGGDPSKPTLLLLHGLSDDKNSFVTSVRELSQNYRIILPDLPGHGGNAQAGLSDLSIAGQAAFINTLVTKLGIDNLVIGGNSMGGHTAVAFAANYPKKTRGLVLINATGMQLSNESVYRFFPDNVDVAFIENTIRLVFVTPPQFPKPIIQHFANELKPRIEFLNALIKQVQEGKDFRLNEKAQAIEIPCLVIWGKEDQIVPIEYGNAYRQALPNASLVELENIGHSPQLEAPEQVQAELSAFMNSL